ncbi:MAG: signal peptidase II [Thermincola sp.]|nr:signal peptidase II [Thermincola sp.]MDT3704029.1 signal peptidase II [Thermincola sp.]
MPDNFDDIAQPVLDYQLQPVITLTIIKLETREFILRFLLLAAGIIFLDQWSKWLVMGRLAEGQSLQLVENIFYLTYVRNPGAAFGMLPYRTTFFVVVTILVMVGIFLLFRYIPDDRIMLKYGLSLQAGGAIGNFIDRLRFGHVIDFFDLRFWPVFNIADVAIVLGVGILIVQLLKSDSRTPGEAGRLPREETSDS